MLSAVRRTAFLSLAFAASTVLAAAQSPVRVAIVGLEHGHVAGFLPQLPSHPDVTLVGISDPDPALREKYAAQFHLDSRLFYPSEEAMIEATHPQAVLVYTSAAGHLPAIEIAARHHVAVMVEKPLTISLKDALAIRRIADDDHIPVLVNYETTWYASNTFAYHALEAGQLGPLRKLVVEDGHEGPKEIGVQPEFLKWLTDPDQNGAGALYDFGCYGVDLATWLMHGATPLTVTAVTQQIKPDVYPRVDDEGTIILTYPHAQAIIQGSWNWPFSRKDMQLYGATGYVYTFGGNKIEVRLKGQSEPQTQTPAPLTSPHDNSLDYLKAVLDGTLKPTGDLTSLDTNVIVTQVLDAARTSARTGRIVHLTPLPK